MKKLIAGLVLAAALAPGAFAQTPPGRSKILTTSPQVVIAPGNQSPIWGSFFRVCNVSTSGTAWLSRDTLSPAPNAAGSYPLPPLVAGQAPSCEELSGQSALFASQKTLSGVSDGPSINLTVEAY